MERIKQNWEAIVRYLREVRGELRKVIWPDSRQTVVLTSVVIVTSVLVGLIIGLADATVSRLFAALLK